jgi:hypothetical protein
MARLLRLTLLVGASLFAVSAALAAEITLYEAPNFGGRSITVRGTVANFDGCQFRSR